MELRQYFSILGKWLWFIVLSVVIASGASYFASRAARPLYSTKTTLMVGRVTQNPDPSSMEINTGQQLALTYTQLARRQPVLSGAIESLGLKMSWEALAGQVRTNVIPNTQLIEISVIDSDPRRAKLLADTIAQQLILQSPTTPNLTDQEQSEFAQSQLVDLKSKIENAQEEILRLKQELDVANSARLIQDLQNQINLLDTKISNWQNTYSQLLVSMQGGDINALSVIEKATVPRRPFSPDVSRNVMFAAIIGLVLAVGGILLIEYLDDLIKTPQDAKAISKLPTLGMIPLMNGKEYTEKLITVRQPLSPVAEAYRVLRTNLQFSELSNPIRTLMVTSPGPEEGKSITLANLAVVIAQSGQRVVLVDANLRRPVLHKIFGMQNRAGLTDAVLYPNTSLSNRLQPTEIKTLQILTSGMLPPNPAEVLGSMRMNEIIEELKSMADFILFDSPPAALVADAAILGTRLDGMLVIFDASHTRRNEARAVVEDLERVKVNILGTVLNRMSFNSRGYNSYNFYEEDKPEDGEKASRTAEKRKLPFPRPMLEKPGEQR